MRSCPYRVDFYAKLTTDPAGGPSVSDEDFNKELDNWLQGLDNIISRMQKFYQEGKHDQGFWVKFN